MRIILTTTEQSVPHLEARKAYVRALMEIEKGSGANLSSLTKEITAIDRRLASLRRKKNRGHMAIMGDVYKLLNSLAYKRASMKAKERMLKPLFEEHQESEKRRVASIQRSKRSAR